MSIFRKIEIALALFLIAVIVGLGVYSYVQKGRADKAAQNSSLQTGRADAAETYNDGFKAMTKEREASHVRVEQAIEANPAWSEQPLPDDVADLLRHPSGSTQAVP